MKRKNRKTRSASTPNRAVAGPWLQFPRAPGANDGFTNASLAQFSSDPASCVRELIQNSLDAALISSERGVAKIRFLVEKIAVEKIPGIKEYREAFNCAKAQKGLNSQAKNVIEEIEPFLQEYELYVLHVADNGIGFDRDGLNAMLGDGSSHKGSIAEEASGSFGNGHLTAFGLSHLRYIFYGGVLEDGGMLSAGHAILATHIGKEGKACSKDGYYVCKIKEESKDLLDRFSFAEKGNIPDILLPQMEQIRGDWGHGALVSIVGFNHFKGKNSHISQARKSVAQIIQEEAALNFFVAINEGRLKIEIHEGNEKRSLEDGNSLHPVLAPRQNEVRRIRDGFPSGKRVWRAYETFHAPSSQHHRLKIIGEGEVEVRWREASESARVALCRNGMWISGDIPRLRTSDFDNKVNFDVLLLVDSRYSGEVHDLLRLAEPPLHNEIDLSRIGAKQKKREVDKILSKIRDEIKGLVPDRSEEPSPINDILSFEESDNVSGRASPTHEKGKGLSMSGVKRRPNQEKDKKEKKKKPSSHSPGKRLSVIIASRQLKPGVIVAVFRPQESCDDVEMWLSLDEGKDIGDSSAAPKYAHITKMSIEGNVIYDGGEKANARSVHLGAWEEGKAYAVSIEYRHPPGAQKCTFIFDFSKRKPKEDKGV